MSKAIKLLVALSVLAALMAAVVACDCDYHAGGCAISRAARQGFKCRCIYKGAWTCSGWSVGCSDDENCPGGDSSREACKLGGGDCGGY